MTGATPSPSSPSPSPPSHPGHDRQEGGVVYHVDPSEGSLLTDSLEGGRRYLVSLSLENAVGHQDYSLSGEWRAI